MNHPNHCGIRIQNTIYTDTKRVKGYSETKTIRYHDLILLVCSFFVPCVIETMTEGEIGIFKKKKRSNARRNC